MSFCANIRSKLVRTLNYTILKIDCNLEIGQKNALTGQLKYHISHNIYSRYNQTVKLLGANCSRHKPKYITQPTSCFISYHNYSPLTPGQFKELYQHYIDKTFHIAFHFCAKRDCKVCQTKPLNLYLIYVVYHFGGRARIVVYNVYQNLY